MLHYHVFAFNPFQENTYVVWNDSQEAAIIDPGCLDHNEQQELVDFIEDQGLTIQHILLTHSHIDHVLGLHFCQQKWGVDALHHPDDLETFLSIPNYAPMYGMPYVEGKKPIPKLTHHSEYLLGTEKFEIRFAPGHAPGHVLLIHHDQGLVFGGDVLFNGSIGRTDLPGGSFPVLEQSIREQVYTLPDTYTIFPGHGPETTVGQEKANNPFVQG